MDDVIRHPGKRLAVGARAYRTELVRFRLVRGFADAEFCQTDVDRQGRVFQRFRIAQVADPFRRFGVQDHVEVARKVRVPGALSAHVKIVFDVALGVVNVGNDHALERHRASLAHGGEFPPNAGIRRLGRVRFAPGLHNVVDAEDAAVFAGTGQFDVQLSEQLAARHIQQFLFVDGQDAVIERRSVPELHVFNVDVINLQSLAH